MTLRHMDFPSGSPGQAYMLDGLGALNNDFMGSCSVYSIIPDSDVAATWARNVGADNFGNVQAGLISGASTALGANRPITTAYTYFRDVIETDPATAAQLQLNRTL